MVACRGLPFALLLLLSCIAVASAHPRHTPPTSRAVTVSKCEGPVAPYRYQFLSVLNDTSSEGIRAYEALVAKWLSLCRPVRWQGGPALTKDFSFYGFVNTTPPTSAIFADYAVWSDWKSVKDLRKCYRIAAKTGLLKKINAATTFASRVVYPLTSAPNPLASCPKRSSVAPAHVRYMVNYVFKVPGPESCAKSQGLAEQLGQNTTLVVRSSDGCNVAPDSVFACGANATANYALARDYNNLDDNRAFLTDPAPVRAALRTEQRSLPLTATRIVIGLSDVCGSRD